MSEAVNPFDQMQRAMSAARTQMRAADAVANDLADSCDLDTSND